MFQFHQVNLIYTYSPLFSSLTSMPNKKAASKLTQNEISLLVIAAKLLDILKERADHPPPVEQHAFWDDKVDEEVVRRNILSYQLKLTISLLARCRCCLRKASEKCEDAPLPSHHPDCGSGVAQEDTWCVFCKLEQGLVSPDRAGVPQAG
jgi:hypothetical protein